MVREALYRYADFAPHSGPHLRRQSAMLLQDVGFLKSLITTQIFATAWVRGP